MKKTLFTLTLISLSAVANAASDPNVSQEGNRSLVKRGACLAYGGHVTTDKRYFICEDGKYDGYMTSGPKSGACQNLLVSARVWPQINRYRQELKAGELSVLEYNDLVGGESGLAQMRQESQQLIRCIQSYEVK